MRLFPVLAVLALLAPAARAQAPITIVVNFAAGGSADRMARLLAPELGEALGTQVVVKTTTGAAGAIGAAEVARARPDGTTLLLTTTGPLGVQPHFRSDLPYRVADFAPLCQLGDAPVMVMSAPGNAVRDAASLVARIRAARGGFNYGSVGPGSIPHIVMVALARQNNLEMTHVPFRGSAEAIIALLRQDVEVYADLPGALRVNNLQAVGVMAEARTAEFPDTPTMREQGYDLVYSIWAGLFAPANTPASFMERAEAACQRALRAPSVVEGFERLSTPITFRGRSDFGQFWAAELEKYREIVQSAGVRPGD